MAESSRFWTTNATGDGPVGGYTQQQFYDFMRKVFITDQEQTRGVVLGEQGALACTGTASPIAVAAGSAIVYGFFYENTASVNLTVTTPTVGTTGGRVILRAGWTAQTVRLVAVRNTDGQIAIPALTQSAGSTWEISLATFTITTGGVIALTDDRKYLEIGSKVIQDGVETLSIKDANVTNAKMAANSVDSAQIVAGAVDLAHMSANSVDSSQIVAGAVDLAHMSANSVGNSQIVADSVDVTKLGNLVMGVNTSGRQGGSASDWSASGSTDYTPGAVRVEFGVAAFTIAANQYEITGVVSFGAHFSNGPVVILGFGAFSTIPNGTAVFCFATGVWGENFTVHVVRSLNPATTLTMSVNWMAIGPE